MIPRPPGRLALRSSSLVITSAPMWRRWSPPSMPRSRASPGKSSLWMMTARTARPRLPARSRAATRGFAASAGSAAAGLSSAVIEGALSSSADYVAVIDGDLQHDETRIPMMLAALASRRRSRHRQPPRRRRRFRGPVSSPMREQLRRRPASALAQRLTGADDHRPDERVFSRCAGRFSSSLPARLTGQGFKIMLDLVLASPHR